MVEGIQLRLTFVKGLWISARFYYRPLSIYRYTHLYRSSFLHLCGLRFSRDWPHWLLITVRLKNNCWYNCRCTNNAPTMARKVPRAVPHRASEKRDRGACSIAEISSLALFHVKCQMSRMWRTQCRCSSSFFHFSSNRLYTNTRARSLSLFFYLYAKLRMDTFFNVTSFLLSYTLGSCCTFVFLKKGFFF